MTSMVAPQTLARDASIAKDAARWDKAVLTLDGQLLQSWRWGAFKAKSGWDVARVAVQTDGGLALAQILFRGKAGLSIGYIPRGPVMPPGASPQLQRDLWASVDNAARARRAVSVIVEPDRDLESVPLGPRVAPGPAHIQPSRTVKIPLLDDQALLAQMHHKTRYNIRLAQRRGVQVRQAVVSDESVATFYTLLEDTSSRNAFGIHEIGYYREFLRTFGEDAALLFADVEGRPAAGLIAASCGDEAVYMYGGVVDEGSRPRRRFPAPVRGHALGAVSTAASAMTFGASLPPTRTRPRSTMAIASPVQKRRRRRAHEFKTRFGGEIVGYPPREDADDHPFLASMARKLYRPWA